jgi:hypothetical protein
MEAFVGYWMWKMLACVGSWGLAMMEFLVVRRGNYGGWQDSETIQARSNLQARVTAANIYGGDYWEWVARLGTILENGVRVFFCADHYR